MTEGEVGAELVRRGWDQGSLIRAGSVPMPYLGRAAAPGNSAGIEGPGASGLAGWGVAQSRLADDECLVIVSQVCDLARSPAQEPYVEAVRAFWTSARSVIHQARTNSLRRFLLRERPSADDGVEALVADSTRRVLIEKAALLALEPEWGFDAGDATRPREFRKWLGERYSREPLPDYLVLAVQRPIVRAVERLRPTDARLQTLLAFREILFVVQNDEPPLQIEILLMLNDGEAFPRPSDDEAAAAAGWLADALMRDGRAVLAHWEVFATTEISVHDYLNAYGLPLDDYTLTEELGRVP